MKLHWAVILILTNFLTNYAYAELSIFGHKVEFRHEEDTLPALDLTNPEQLTVVKRVYAYRRNSWFNVTPEQMALLGYGSNQLIVVMTSSARLGVIFNSQGAGVLVAVIPDQYSNLERPPSAAQNTARFRLHSPYQDLVSSPLSCVDINNKAYIFKAAEKLKRLRTHLKMSPFEFAYKSSQGIHGDDSFRAKVHAYFDSVHEEYVSLDTRNFFYQDHSDCFYVLERVGYNYADAGNFAWGRVMKELGYRYWQLKIGSELNALVNTRKQNFQGNGIILMGDSRADQKAIYRGYYSGNDLDAKF